MILNRQFPIQYQRHSGQQEVLSGMLQCYQDTDVFVIVGSRGWGKSLYAVGDIVLPTMLKNQHSQILWVAPSYKICKSPIDDVWFGVDENTGQRFVPQFDPQSGYQFWNYRSGDMEIELFNGAKLYNRSADNPDSIVSKGYNLVVVDEAAQISREVFFQHILPTARRRGCKIVLITSPRGRNWIYEFYIEGQNRAKKGIFSIRQPWWKRPNYPEVLKRLMKTMPTHLRQQEFEAEFISDASGAFRNVAKVFAGPEIQFTDDHYQEWAPTISQDELDKEPWVIAADLAKQSDFTVILAFSLESRRLGYFCRMNKTDYKLVLDKIARVSEKFDNADVIYDCTGVGGGLQDFMGRRFNSHPFLFTNDSKTEIVNRLIASFDYCDLELPNLVPMREEFELFTYSISKTGKLLYSAPDGKKDDTVMAMAMANWYASENSGKGQVHEIDNYLETMGMMNREKTELDRLMEEDD